MKDVGLFPLPLSERSSLIARYFHFDEHGWAHNNNTAVRTVTAFFPRDERATNRTDVVAGYIILDKRGSIRDVYVRYTYPNFARAAALALRSYSFSPGDTERLVVIHVSFNVDNSGDFSSAREVECTHPDLRRELLNMRQKDQSARQQLILQNGSDAAASLKTEIKNLDQKHSERLKSILQQNGWPGVTMVGADGTEAAFLIIQHSPDLAFQKAILPTVHSEALALRLSMDCYAVLQDRVLVREGKPQIFGSQAKPIEEWPNSGPALEPIIDEPNVDKRRSEIGLDPIAFYLRTLEAHYRPGGTAPK